MDLPIDKYNIDSHKLIYHISRLHDWLEGKTIYPLYMEASPSGACNHRCTYCALDFMEYRPCCLDTALWKERLAESGKLGLKSIMYAGEGEPLLHKDMAEIISCTKKAGIDAAVTTNGVLLNKDITDSILGDAEWIKVSIDAATPQSYAKIHRSPPNDFDRVIENISYAVKAKQDNNYNCTLGMQMVLLPENVHEAAALAKLSRDMGMDYLVIKPYSQHPQSKTRIYSTVEYSNYMFLAGELTKFNTDKFTVIFRTQAMEKWDSQEQGYNRCLAFGFWSYIDAAGNVWGCSVYIGDERFLYGNIYQHSFQEIWEGSKRLNSLRWAEENFDASQCRINCRMDNINHFLWGLKRPPAHVNFI